MEVAAVFSQGLHPSNTPAARSPPTTPVEIATTSDVVGSAMANPPVMRVKLRRASHRLSIGSSWTDRLGRRREGRVAPPADERNRWPRAPQGHSPLGVTLPRQKPPCRHLRPARPSGSGTHRPRSPTGRPSRTRDVGRGTPQSRPAARRDRGQQRATTRTARLRVNGWLQAHVTGDLDLAVVRPLDRSIQRGRSGAVGRREHRLALCRRGIHRRLARLRCFDGRRDHAGIALWRVAAVPTGT